MNNDINNSIKYKLIKEFESSRKLIRIYESNLKIAGERVYVFMSVDIGKTVWYVRFGNLIQIRSMENTYKSRTYKIDSEEW